jgi:hypothetical protein
LVSSDLNRDGLADLVAVNPSSNELSILLAREDGSFPPPESIPTGERPVSVATGDLDTDGVTDLVVANRNSDNLLVLKGRGDGRFDPLLTVEEVWCPSGVNIGDLNSDTWLDLALKSSAHSSYCGHERVSVLLGRGDGSFLSEAHYDVGVGKHSIAIGDLDEDGRIDIALSANRSASFESGVVSVFFNQGPYPAIPVEIDLLPGNPDNPVNLSSNGVTPVAVLSSAEVDALAVLPGTLRLAGAPVRQAGGGRRWLCHENDVNADGLPDLVCHVETSEIRLPEEEPAVVLEAEMSDGGRIRGEDAVRVVP